VVEELHGGWVKSGIGELVVDGGVVLDERQCRPSYRVWDAHFGYTCGLLRN
jgi:hypothetical protein